MPPSPSVALVWLWSVRFQCPCSCVCPKARVRLVNGELLSWYGPRTVAGLAYLRDLAT